VRGAPRAQPRGTLLQREPPRRVGGDLHLVGPVQAQAAIADGDSAERDQAASSAACLRAERGEDRVLGEARPDVDLALGAALPVDDQAAGGIGVDGADPGLLGLHDQVRRFRLCHS
jgi:hypothetical protein